MLISILAVAGMVYGASRQPKFEIVTEHNVKVWNSVDIDKWFMTSDEHPKGFLYTGCSDFPNASVIWAGYIADYAKWEEQGSCKSIRRADCEFHWLRDEHFNVRRVN